eukprot:9977304-Ditylum_brightwellii.AAC.1
MSTFQNFDFDFDFEQPSNKTTNYNLHDELQKAMENGRKEMEAVWEEIEARRAIRYKRWRSMLSNTAASYKE